MFIPLLTVAILSPGLVCQDPGPEKGKGKEAGKVVQDASSKKDSSTLKTWDDKEAKAALAVFNKEYKTKSLEQKLAALEKLSGGQSSKLVRPLAKVVKTERKHESCRIRAAELLGNQDHDAVRKTLLSLIGDAKIKRTPSVLAALIRAHSKASYESKDWDDFKQLFSKDIDNRKFPKVQQAIVQMIGENKELQGLDLLAESMEGPQPDNVDDPNNPPASYWEARWKNWEVWRQDAKNALFKIAGEQFNTNKEAKAWVSKNRKRLELEQKKAEKEARQQGKKR
jgi:hypothetical protein